MRATFLTVLLFLASCNTNQDVSLSDPYFKNVIGATVCTKTNTFLVHWDTVSDHPQQEYQLTQLRADSDPYPYTDATVREFRDNWIGGLDDYIKDVSLIKKGTKLQVEKVHYYDKFACCSGHLVMALVNGSTQNGKMVNIADLYGTYEPHALKEKHAEYCN